MGDAFKDQVLREYGSWSVLTIAFLIGLVASRGFVWQAIPVFVALALLINSKLHFTQWVRRKGGAESLFIFLGHVTVATVILVVIFSRDILFLLPLIVFPIIYLFLNKFAGEHALLTEITGFVLISLAAVLAKFTVVHGIDVPLFIAVAFYFSAGVFKVKILLLRKTRDRILSVLFLLFTILLYHGYHLSLILLIPLIDNLVISFVPYKVRLKTTGWIEVSKSILFLFLMAVYY